MRRVEDGRMETLDITVHGLECGGERKAIITAVTVLDRLDREGQEICALQGRENASTLTERNGSLLYLDR